MMGIDLGTKNLAIYGQGKESILSLDDFLSIEDMAEILSAEVKQYNCAVDYSWSMAYWPGNKKTKMQMSFLLGVIFNSSLKTIIVEPRQIRDMLGIPATIPKKELHRIAFAVYPELKALSSPHLVDAALLQLWGEKNNARF